MIRPQVNGLRESGAVTAMQSIDRHAGWWPEADTRYTSGHPKAVLPGYCQPLDIIPLTFAPDSSYYTVGSFGSREFYPTAVFNRFADLAAMHGLTLVIAFQPHPCSSIRPESLRVLTDSISAVKRRYVNVKVLPESIFEHWPREQFTNVDHLRAGYDVPDSERLGRLLGAALAKPEPPAAPDLPFVPDSGATTPNVWSQDGLAESWHTIGVSAHTDKAGIGTITIIEERSAPRNYFEAILPEIEPGKPYVFSITAKPTGAGAINIVIRDHDMRGRTGQIGSAVCDFAGATSTRSLLAFDNDIEALPDGWWRCWVSVLICDSSAVVGVDIQDDQRAPTEGSERGLLIREARVQPGWRRVPENSAPLPPIAPAGQSCPTPPV